MAIRCWLSSFLKFLAQLLKKAQDSLVRQLRMGKSYPSTETNRTHRQLLTTLSPTSVPTKHVRIKLRPSILSQECQHRIDRGKERSTALTTFIPRLSIQRTKT